MRNKNLTRKMLTHLCRRCGFQAPLFEQWLNHLWEQQHQVLSRSSFLKWSDEENQRSLVIYAPSTPYPLPSEVLELFLNLDIMTVDFVCWTERPQNFVIQFLKREDVEKVMKIMNEEPNLLTFRDNTLGLRRKSDVADFEWPGLIGAGTARDGSSADVPVLIELSDDSNNSDENGENGHTNGQAMDTSAFSETSSTTNGYGEMETDVTNGHDNGVGEVVPLGEDVDVSLESKISDEFRTKFLEKIKSMDKSKDDKKKVKEQLKKLQSYWLDVLVGFHNRLWPLCFVMSNQDMTTNRNEVGYEAKFTCSTFHNKFNSWLSSNVFKKEDVDKTIQDCLKLITNEQACSKRHEKITKLEKGNKILKFECHIVVSFSESGYTFARVKLEKVEGVEPERKMKILKRIYKHLFLEYEKYQINQFNPNVKAEIKRENQGGNKNRKWTELEIITVD